MVSFNIIIETAQKPSTYRDIYIRMSSEYLDMQQDNSNNNNK